MGASCVRDCERTSHEYTAEESQTLGSIGIPGLSNGGVVARTTKGCTYDDSIGTISADSSDSVVPPVPNWFQVLNNNTRDANAGTPRFDEAILTPNGTAQPVVTPGGHDQGRRMSNPSTQVTPRAQSIASDFRTPGATPRESPRAPEERPAEGMKSDEVSYEGSYLGHMKHGAGRLRTSTFTYDGHFQCDHKHGNGVLTWDDGRQYRGQFEAGKFHGAAVMTWPDGRKYCGQYGEDRKHGDGTFSWQDGRRYQGQWVVGKRHGIGIYTNAKGVTRTGVWQMDRPLHWDVPGPQDAMMSARKESTEATQKATETTASLGVQTPRVGESVSERSSSRRMVPVQETILADTEVQTAECTSARKVKTPSEVQTAECTSARKVKTPSEAKTDDMQVQTAECTSARKVKTPSEAKTDDMQVVEMFTSRSLGRSSASPRAIPMSVDSDLLHSTDNPKLSLPLSANAGSTDKAIYQPEEQNVTPRTGIIGMVGNSSQHLSR
eukprot:TRINITY_DN9725_c0_g1_i5.p1 TRINITY_DN9725_c0_g1~~TRINITY_DN9725_c0_g1_i5.p1  ORF type:complete len:493 (+),score=69.07 TRINITY_DN9725_c0_g1_i5:98-1576(+)